MSLEAGHKLAHYEILEPIGVGGMGEVYRARDRKLDRDVAIKVLPDAFAKDEERLRRFQVEAKVLASLNHPNIAAIYGLEQSAETHYLVLELIFGETLAERISRGPIPVDEALEIATKIAEALEEAHEQGVVHRDLKPANIKYTEDGKVKVLDFGLAKVFHEETPEADTSMSPTLTRDATRVGVILGTAAYMSPEQAKGKRIDKRTDIFAFGAVLHEMLTGKKAFPGEDVSEVLASVLKLEPDWDALPAEVLPVVRRCLEKDPRLRMRDIGDARIQLADSLVPKASVRARTKRNSSMVYPALGLVAGLAIATVFFSSRAPHDVADRSVGRATIALPAGQTQSRAFLQPMAISPDGSQLVYLAEDDTGPNLFLRKMDSYEVRKLPGTSYASTPFFSPDGRSIGFFATGELKTMSLEQGSPVTLAHVRRGIGGSWGPNDTIVFADEVGGLYQVSAAGGVSERLTTPDYGEGGYAHVFPSHLPGGRRVLFTAWGRPTRGAVLDLETKTWEPVHASVDGAMHVSSGHLLFADMVKSPSLFAVPVDDRGIATGTPVAVLDGVQYGTYAGRHFATVSDNGTLVYAPSTDGQALLQWLERDGTLTPIRSHALGIASPRLSPSGDRVVFLGRRYDIWVLDLVRGSVDLLVPHSLDYENWNPIWTPDGQSVTFSSNRGGSWNLYEVTPGGEPTPLFVRESGSIHAHGWSPDGQLLAVKEYTERGMDLSVLPRGGEPGEMVVTDANEFAPTLSPDGRWIAYVSDHTGAFQIYMRAFPDGESFAVSTRGGEEPQWSADGGELYFRRGESLFAVSVSEGPAESSVEVSPARLLLKRPFDRTTYGNRAAYDVASDGRFPVVTNTWNTELKVVFNWFEELNRLVPRDN